MPAFPPPWPVGISDHAQKELGDIVYVDLPEAGDSMAVGKTIAAVESVKAAADGVHARHQCVPSNMASLPAACKQKRGVFAHAAWPLYASSRARRHRVGGVGEGEGAVLMPCVCRAVYSPVSGEIVESNDALGDEPGERERQRQGQRRRAKEGGRGGGRDGEVGGGGK